MNKCHGGSHVDIFAIFINVLKYENAHRIFWCKDLQFARASVEVLLGTIITYRMLNNL